MWREKQGQGQRRAGLALQTTCSLERRACCTCAALSYSAMLPRSLPLYRLAVCMTTTVNTGFGSKVISKSTGERCHERQNCMLAAGPAARL